MRTWLVTGASGFLGANLGHWLNGRARRVGMSRSASTPGLFDETVAVDLLDPDAVSASIRRLQPDVIVHTAAFASHVGCEADSVLAHRMNVDAARTVASAAAATGARLIHISTDAVFDGARGGYRETDEPSPFSVYGESKLLGEQAVLGELPSALVVRTNFFGWSPTGTRSILEFFVNALSEGTSVQGFTDFLVTSIYAQQLAAVLFEIASLPIEGLLHVASADAVSKYDFGVTIARAFELDESLIAPTPQGVGPDGISRSRDISLNTDRLASLLGRRPPSQGEGIEAAYADRPLRAVFAQKP